MKKSIVPICFVLSLALLSPRMSLAQEYNECILANMKGVTSDVAARAVRDACQQKASSRSWEEKQAKEKAMIEKYGVDTSIDVLEEASHYNVLSPSMSSMKITNKSRDKTVTYVKFSVCTVYTKKEYPYREGCDYKDYPYVMTLTPGSSVNLLFPKNEEGAVRTRVLHAKARPSKWNDFSISGSLEPVDKDPF